MVAILGQTRPKFNTAMKSKLPYIYLMGWGTITLLYLEIHVHNIYLEMQFMVDLCGSCRNKTKQLFWKTQGKTLCGIPPSMKLLYQKIFFCVHNTLFRNPP